MFNAEVRRLLIEVISSWQVIAVTVVLIIYIALVRYVAKIYHRRIRRPSRTKVKPEKADIPVPSETDELSLEEQ